MKKYTQFGTFCLVIFVPILLILIIRLFMIGISFDPESIGLQALILIIFACLFTFYKLTIFIDEKNVSFKFGIDWFGKSYQFSEIESCEAVKNPILAGIGIRWLGNGWLYNVSGFKAIELTFRNKKSIVRIGTDKPEEITQVIQEKIRLQN